MTDEQDVSIAVMKLQLAAVENELDEVKKIAYSLRDDRLRIEGGRLVLWFLGGLVLAAIGAWYSVTNSTPIQRFFGIHG